MYECKVSGNSVSWRYVGGQWNSQSKISFSLSNRGSDASIIVVEKHKDGSDNTRTFSLKEFKSYQDIGSAKDEKDESLEGGFRLSIPRAEALKLLKEANFDEFRQCRNYDDPVLNASQVATLLGLDRKTVYEAANRRENPCRRLGRRLWGIVMS